MRWERVSWWAGNGNGHGNGKGNEAGPSSLKEQREEERELSRAGGPSRCNSQHGCRIVNRRCNTTTIISSSSSSSRRRRRSTWTLRGGSRAWASQSAVICVGLCLLLLVTASTAQRKASLEKRFERLKNLSLIPALGDPARFVDHRDRTSLLSRILIPRVPESAGSKKVLDALKEPFEALNKDAKSLGWHVQTLPFETKTPHGNKKMTNLVITKNPASPRRLTLAAHYDSKVLPRGFLGATDSAAPCAIIVDTAIALDAALDKAERRYAKEGKGKGSDVTLQLIFFDGEEAYGQWTHTDSIYGSKDLASNWTRSAHSPPHAPPVGAARLSQARFASERPVRSIDTIEHLVLLDLLGASHPQIPPYFPGTSWLNTRLSEAQKRLQQELLFWPPNQTPNRHDEKWFGGHAWGGIEDDHLPFLANGVPILHLIPTPFPAVWHTMKDDASALDYGTNYGWTMLMRLFVAEYLNLAAADLEQAPRANRQREEVREELLERQVQQGQRIEMGRLNAETEAEAEAHKAQPLRARDVDDLQ